ncbi:MAG TPA: PIN domain-containing protein [Candidatus Manganitrophaceae bacterium]|nr:PIN domain-containing protein [Candidatus Manganitrophaceae bacterium]
MNPPPRQLFCDTSFLYACLEEEDRHYEDAGRLLEFCKANRVEFLTTWEIIIETVALLRSRSGYRLAVDFLDALLPKIRLVEHDPHLREAALEVFRRMSRGKALSLCNALSYVVVTQLLENIPCLSFDSDFKRLGLTVLAEPLD